MEERLPFRVIYLKKHSYCWNKQTKHRKEISVSASQFSPFSFLESMANLTVVVCSGQIHIVQTNTDKGEGGGWQIKINHTGV